MNRDWFFPVMDNQMTCKPSATIALDLGHDLCENVTYNEMLIIQTKMSDVELYANKMNQINAK